MADVVTFQRGFDLPNGDRRPGDYPVIGSTAIGGYHDEYKVMPPVVTTGRSGSLGQVVLSKVASWPLNTTLWVKDFHGNDPIFIYYMLQTLGLERFNAGAGVPTLNRNHLASLEAPVPPLSTQRKIAAILSAYDDLIENNTRRVQVLEDMARALYREWFIEYRHPGHEHNEFVEDEQGRRPKGWEIGRLDDCLVLQRGFDLPTNQRVAGTFPIIASTGINGTHAEMKVAGPGVVTGRSGSLGTVMLVLDDFWPLNTTLWVKNFKRGGAVFASHLLSGLDLAQYNSGAAVPTLNRNDIHGLPVTLPPQMLLDQFEEIGMTLQRQVRQLRLRNDNLRRTRDLLLPRLVSGELDVSELDIAGVEDDQVKSEGGAA